MGPGPITGRHSECTLWPLKSCQFRAAVHGSPSLISASNSGGKSGSDPGFQKTLSVYTHTRARTHVTALFPSHTHLTNDEWGDAFEAETLFSHTCKRRKRGQELHEKNEPQNDDSCDVRPRSPRHQRELTRPHTRVKNYSSEWHAGEKKEKKKKWKWNETQPRALTEYWGGKELKSICVNVGDSWWRWSCFIWKIARLSVDHSPLAWLNCGVGAARSAADTGSVQNSWSETPRPEGTQRNKLMFNSNNFIHFLKLKT